MTSENSAVFQTKHVIGFSVSCTLTSSVYTVHDNLNVYKLQRQQPTQLLKTSAKHWLVCAHARAYTHACV